MVGSDSSVMVSVLIAAYNQAGFVRETLESVERQSFDDYEVVVVDDGSTDDTPKIIEEWASCFRARRKQRVVVERTVNRGQSAALEHGFGFCRGRYICLLDSDDRWMPSKLERVVESAKANPQCGMLVHPLFVIDSEGSRTGDVRPKGASLSDGDLREQVQKTCRQVAPATAGVIIRDDIFRALLPMPTKCFHSAADSYLTFGASLLAPVKVIREPLGEYRMHFKSHYLERVSNRDGLQRTVRIHRTITEHFNLGQSWHKNAYFVRHEFALKKFDGDLPGQVRSYFRLITATLFDCSYSYRQKMMFILFWSACLASPVPVFRKLWGWFQVRHTGHDRLSHSPAL